MLSRTMDLRLFNQSQLHGIHRSLCLCHKVNMLDAAFIERNCPVRIVTANRSRNIESIRKLHIYSDIRVGIQIRRKVALIGRIIHDMIIQMLLCLHRIDTQLALDCRISKNIRTILLIQHIIGNMLYDSRCLLIIDQLCCLCDEFLRIIFELIEYIRLDSLQYSNNRLTGKPSLIYQLADQIIFHVGVGSHRNTIASGLFLHK